MKLPKLHYAWLILLLCFLGILAAQGMRLSFGAFIEPWQQTFHVDRSTISFVSFLSFLVYGLSQPVVGRLVDRYGVRTILSGGVLLVSGTIMAISFVRTPLQLLLLYGVVASLGFGGASGVAASVAVTKWFHTRRGLAFGIVEAGFAVGQLILVPTSLLLITSWGWRRTLFVLGMGTGLMVVPLLMLLRSTPRDRGLRPYGQDAAKDGSESNVDVVRNDTSDPVVPVSIWRSRALWGLVLPFFICGFTTTGMIDTHLIPFAHDHGYAVGITGATVSLLAAFNIVGTLASGPLSDRWDNRRILGTLYGVRAVSLLLLLTMHQPQWLLAFGVIFGLVDFAVLAPTQLLASRYFAAHSPGLVFGLLSLAHQCGSALGSYIPGILYDRTGSYTLPFAAGAAILVIGAFLSFTLPRTHAVRSSSLVTAAA